MTYNTDGSPITQDYKKHPERYVDFVAMLGQLFRVKDSEKVMLQSYSSSSDPKSKDRAILDFHKQSVAFMKFCENLKIKYSPKKKVMGK